ncbi:muts domain V-domain-containing protein [Zopfochytrium polystomum]|nr:muts domain V-domain-containing protein [Zopfochytrium polystomum]
MHSLNTITRSPCRLHPRAARCTATPLLRGITTTDGTVRIPALSITSSQIVTVPGQFPTVCLSLLPPRRFKATKSRKKTGEDSPYSEVVETRIRVHLTNRRPVPIPVAEGGNNVVDNDTQDDANWVGNERREAIDEPDSPQFRLDRHGVPRTLKDEILFIQSKYPDHILLTQVGGFYEIYSIQPYFEEIANLLDLAISKTGMCGFPLASLNRYVERLIEHGKTVAIVSQVARDFMSLGKNFSRAVTRIVTPGTALNDTEESMRQNQFLLSVAALGDGDSTRLGLAWGDINTGDFVVTQCAPEALSSMLARVDPAEVIVSEDAPPTVYEALRERKRVEHLTITPLKAQSFGRDDCLKTFHHFLAKMDPKLQLPLLNVRSSPAAVLKREMSVPEEAMMAAGALLSYVNANFYGLSPYFHVDGLNEQHLVMHLDASTVASLEIVRSIREGDKKGTLFHELDRTKTAPGSRLLASRLKNPSIAIDRINHQLDLIEVFRENPELMRETRAALVSFRDIERALQRLHLNSARHVDLTTIVQSLGSIRKLRNLLDRFLKRLDPAAGPSLALKAVAEQLDPLDSLAARQQDLLSQDSTDNTRMITKDGSEKKSFSATGMKVGTISPGVSKELDEIFQKYQLCKSKALVVLNQISKKHRNLFLLYFTVSRVLMTVQLLPSGCDVALTVDPRDGPVIQIHKGKSAGFPKSLASDPQIEDLPRQKLTNKRQYRHKLWSELFDALASLETQIDSIERNVFDSACQEIKEETSSIILTSRAVAEIDVASAMAELSIERSYCRPLISDAPELLIRKGRHPVVEKMQLNRDTSFVPNDLHLSTETPVWVVTGANMGGKSTFLRQCAIIVLMAQAGLFVPAETATIGIVHKLFSRIGSSDNLAGNQSTFMVEMTETANILRNADSRSLVIVDELGRGTASQDGLSIACAILKRLLAVNRSLTLFATHHHEIRALLPKSFGEDEEVNAASLVRYYRMKIHDDGGAFAFLYELEDGLADRSHGIEIARLAGIPDDVVQTAHSLYKSLDEARTHHADTGESELRLVK